VGVAGVVSTLVPALGQLANLKETCKVKGACRNEATSITTVFKE
jgi:hypothetical protein